MMEKYGAFLRYMVFKLLAESNEWLSAKEIALRLATGEDKREMRNLIRRVRYSLVYLVDLDLVVNQNYQVNNLIGNRWRIKLTIALNSK